MFDKNEDLNKKKLIIEITDLVNDEDEFDEEELDEYCQFMKQMFLKTSGLN